MQFVATVGITFQMCILVTGQFGKSISYNKFLVLKVVCIYFLLNKTKLNQVNFPFADGSTRGLFSLISSIERPQQHVCTIYQSFFLLFYLQKLYLKQLKS